MFNLSPKFKKTMLIIFVKRGRVNPISIRPIAIFKGNPTIRMLIWGTVLTINPNPILVINRAVIIGAPILTAMIKISFEISIID